MSKSKDKGTRAESRVVKYLLDNGIKAKRKALAGKDDKGDIEAYYDSWLSEITLEVKTGKMTQCYSRTQLGEWMRQAWQEGINSGTGGYLVIVRYGRKISDAEVWWYDEDLGTRLMMYLDEFVASWIKHGQ